MLCYVMLCYVVLCCVVLCCVVLCYVMSIIFMHQPPLMGARIVTDGVAYCVYML